MCQFGVLTNRKRAVIALIHSIVFLGIALHGFASPKSGILHGSKIAGDVILIGIYAVVAAILIWLASISRGSIERVYFALCATSASSGLVRTVFGDRVIPPAQYLRVLMLSSAVAIGFVIVRCYARNPIEDETEQVSADISLQ